MRLDGAKEFIEGDSNKFLNENRTVLDDFPLYLPQSNGQAE